MTTASATARHISCCSGRCSPPVICLVTLSRPSKASSPACRASSAEPPEEPRTSSSSASSKTSGSVPSQISSTPPIMPAGDDTGGDRRSLPHRPPSPWGLLQLRVLLPRTSIVRGSRTTLYRQFDARSWVGEDTHGRLSRWATRLTTFTPATSTKGAHAKSGAPLVERVHASLHADQEGTGTGNERRQTLPKAGSSARSYGASTTRVDEYNVWLTLSSTAITRPM